MARKPIRPRSSMRDRASALKKKAVPVKPKKVVVPVKKKPVSVKKLAVPVKPKKIVKHVTKPVTKKVAPKIKIKKPTGSIEKQLAENFISLQKVMVNLSVKFDNLTNNIAKLLELFEISAKSLAKKDFAQDKKVEDVKEIKTKMDGLFQQNKVIARGLTLLHEGLLGEEPPMPEPVAPPQPPAPRPLPPGQLQQRRPPAQMPPRPPMPRPPQPRQPQQPSPAPPSSSQEGYEKSLSSQSSQSQQFKKLPGSSGQGV